MTRKTQAYRDKINELTQKEADLCFQIRELTAQLRDTRAEKAQTYTKLGKASSGQNEIQHHNEPRPWENIDLAFHIEYEDEPASYPGMTCREPTTTAPTASPQECGTLS